MINKSKPYSRLTIEEQLDADEFELVSKNNE